MMVNIPKMILLRIMSPLECSPCLLYIDALLTCVFRKLFKEFIRIPVLGDVANEETMVVK